MNITTDAIHTYENLLYRNKVKTFSIYIVVLLSLFVLLISLPFIKELSVAVEFYFGLCHFAL